MKQHTTPQSFVQILAHDYPIDTVFWAVSGDVHSILTERKQGMATAESQLQLLEKMMDVSPDGTGIVHGHQLAVIDRIRTDLWFAGLLKLGQALKTEEHRMFFSRLMFSFMGNRLKNPDVAFETDMQDFGNFSREAGFELYESPTQFLEKSPACFHLFDPKKVAA